MSAGGNCTFDSLEAALATTVYVEVFTNDIKGLMNVGWWLSSGIRNMDFLKFDELSYGEYAPDE